MTSISKTQVDQLGVRLRKGGISDDDLRRLDAYRGSFAEAYEEVVATIRSSTGLEPAGRRAKSTPSIIEKLWRETIRLSQMQDIAGCRVVVANILEQDRVIERLTRAFVKADVIDRRKQPSYGYRAGHIIATARGKPVEIQVRTELQHLWAQLSEVMSDALDPSIKYGGGDPKLQRALSRISESIAKLEAAELAFADDPALLEREQGFAELKALLPQLLKRTIAIYAAMPRRVN